MPTSSGGASGAHATTSSERSCPIAMAAAFTVRRVSPAPPPLPAAASRRGACRRVEAYMQASTCSERSASTRGGPRWAMAARRQASSDAKSVPCSSLSCSRLVAGASSRMFVLRKRSAAGAAT